MIQQPTAWLATATNPREWSLQKQKLRNKAAQLLGLLPEVMRMHVFRSQLQLCR